MLAQSKIKLLSIRKYLKQKLLELFPNNHNNNTYMLPPVDANGSAQNGIAVITIIKNEAPYLAEWLEFHFMLGVRHIYIYDNGSTDEMPNVVAPYIRTQTVTIVPWRNFSVELNPQLLAYAHALANFGWRYRWVSTIDVDEFLFPVEGNSLERALAEFEDQPVINLPWINFGPSGHKTKPDGLVIENYTERAAFPPRADQYSLLRYKSIINPREVQTAGAHDFLLRGKGRIMMNDRGEIFAPYKERNVRYASADKIRLHHYFTRSEEEIQNKLNKGRVSKKGKVNPAALDRRLKQYALATERDETILRFVPELKKRLAERHQQVRQDMSPSHELEQFSSAELHIAMT